MNSRFKEESRNEFEYCSSAFLNERKFESRALSPRIVRQTLNLNQSKPPRHPNSLNFSRSGDLSIKTASLESGFSSTTKNANSSPDSSQNQIQPFDYHKFYKSNLFQSEGCSKVLHAVNSSANSSLSIDFKIPSNQKAAK